QPVRCGASRSLWGIGRGTYHRWGRIDPLSRTEMSPMTVKSANSVDKHVGARVRMRRLMMHMSQTALAQALGVTFQQIQKYENGLNRIGASRLQRIAGALDVPIGFFFEGAPGQRTDAGDQLPGHIDEFLSTADGLALSAAFVRIKDVKARRLIVDLAKQLSQ